MMIGMILPLHLLDNGQSGDPVESPGTAFLLADSSWIEDSVAADLASAWLTAGDADPETGP